ncbi:MAG: cardiolipin synthase [Salinisphaeraceae bacterium]|nr:cardiolipin synthase [Salinisphaeraceae bacterium]
MEQLVAEFIAFLPLLGFSWPVFWALHFVLMPMAVGHVLLHKRMPQATFGWLVLIVFAPVIGAVTYCVFGVNRIYRRAQRLGRGQVRDQAALTDISDEAALESLDPKWLKIAEAAGKLSDLPLTQGNAIEHFHTGDELFPAMLCAIDEAQDSIYLSSYTFDLAGIGKQFVESLARAKKRGVDVRVLVDSIGDRVISHAGVIDKLQSMGIDALHFLPPSVWPPMIHLNLRNHRKILIVDKQQAFTGGINITQKNCSQNGNEPSNDDHFRFTGPVVTQLLAVFAEDWAFAASTNNDISLPEDLPSTGQVPCRVIPDGPDHPKAQILMLMTAAVGQASQQVTIFSPYFLPIQPLTGAMCASALRGVKVRVLIPKQSNYAMVDWACRHYLPDLLHAGVEIYAIDGPLMHSKLFVVDEEYAMVGSTNIDPRSLQLNFELMVEVYDHGFAKQMQEHAEKQFAQSERITLQSLAELSMPIRLRNALAGLAQPYL